MNVTDIINLITNSGVAIFVVAYFIFKDNKFNNELIKTLTEITVTLKTMQTELSKTRDNTEILKDENGGVNHVSN